MLQMEKYLLVIGDDWNGRTELSEREKSDVFDNAGEAIVQKHTVCWNGNIRLGA